MKVTVKVSELKSIMIENRRRHSEKVAKAMDIYRRKVIEEMEILIADAKAGKKIRTSVSMPVPEVHTADYDAVIGMLEMSTEDEIELSRESYDCFVLDRWDWMRSFARNTLDYLEAGE